MLNDLVPKTILITGGAGFIGSHTARHFASRGHAVIVFDNFSRNGSRETARRLQRFSPRISMIEGSVTNFELLHEIVPEVDAIFHFAAQVAVTTSVLNPRRDFKDNLFGTLNVLDAARLSPKKPLVVYSSTNKVYGGLRHIPIAEKETRYEFEDVPGVDERCPLDFHSPYGCSKGAADQYVRDYARIYGLPTVVLRQSCIYGEEQHGIEDQGWVAWFAISHHLGRPLTIYGNGKQVRDLLYVGDLVELYDRILENPEKARGKIYNVGGGQEHAHSVLEVIAEIERLTQRKVECRFVDWRPGDQKVYVSNISKVRQELGWQPRISFEQALAKMIPWIKEAYRLV